MNQILKDYIKAQNEFQLAKSKLDSARAKATELVLDLGVESANMDGYNIVLKQYKKPRSESSAEIMELQAQLDEQKARLAQDNADEIRNLQKSIFYANLEIERLLSNDQVADLEHRLNAARANLAEQRSTYYEVYAKPDPKSGNYLKSLVEERKLNELLAQGSALRKQCGKAITKASVFKFILAWSVTDDDLDEAWAEYVEQHKRNSQR